MDSFGGKAGWGTFGRPSFAKGEPLGKGKGKGLDTFGKGKGFGSGKGFRPEWDPRNARNLDLEIERAGKGFGCSWYSDHDDRREPPPRASQGSSSPTRWGHDLFESVISDEGPAAKKMRSSSEETPDERHRRNISPPPEDGGTGDEGSDVKEDLHHKDVRRENTDKEAMDEDLGKDVQVGDEKGIKQPDKEDGCDKEENKDDREEKRDRDKEEADDDDDDDGKSSKHDADDP